MQSLWNDTEAAQFTGPLGPRVYTSRLLGRDKTLVLHGGGNTSVKLREKNLFGEEEDVLYVKGSGWDLETIEAAGFAPVQLDYVQRLARLPSLSDPQMVNELATHMLRAERARAFGRDAAARHPAAQVRRSHARRRGAVGVEFTRRREAHPRDLRRPGGGDSVHHGRLRSRGVLRARVPETGRRQHHRHGAALARRIFVRRRCAAVLRAHDQAGVDGRGLPRCEEGMEPAAAGGASRGHRSQCDRRAAARGQRQRRISTGRQDQRFGEIPGLCGPQRRGAGVAARPGDAGPRDPHQAAADARARRGGFRERLSRILRPPCPAREGKEDHPRRGAAHGARPGVRIRRVRAHREGHARSSKNSTITPST